MHFWRSTSKQLQKNYYLAMLSGNFSINAQTNWNDAQHFLVWFWNVITLVSLQHLVFFMGEVWILYKTPSRTLLLVKQIDSVNLAFEIWQVFSLHHELLLFCYFLLFITFSPREVVDRYPQFLVDGPCDVLFPWNSRPRWIFLRAIWG